jgi:hypothetical protein
MPQQPTPQSIAAILTVPQRVLLFCVASGTDHRKAGITPATVQLCVVRDLIERREAPARLVLTDKGRAVLAALLGA